MEAKLIKTKEGSYQLKFKNDDDMMECSLGLLSLKNCRSIEKGYDLDELAKTHHRLAYAMGYNSDIAEYVENDYKAGFQKALEICYNSLDVSYRRTEWDVEIEMEHIIYPANMPKEGEERPAVRPKLDENGYLILKRI